MDKNKSIDGLEPRRSKKATTLKNTTSSKTFTSKSVSKSTISKPSSKTSTTKSAATALKNSLSEYQAGISAKTPVSKTSKISKTPKISKTTETVKIQKPTPLASTEDFLKPVQAFDFDEQSGELKIAASPIATTKTPKTPVINQKGKTMKNLQKPTSKKRKIILGIIITILSLILIAGTIFVLWGNDIIAKITGGQGNVLDFIFADDQYEPLKTDANGRTNILALGTSGYNMAGDEGNGTHDGAQLTDSIMVISLNQDTGDIAMLSLPRDLKASPTCTATGKINEVYWCNNINGDNEAAGATALMAEVGNILGMDFQYYAHLNWGSLVSIVDTLGGITITLDEDIEDYYYTKAVYQAGVEYTINGEEALGLARARHGTTSGDFSRGASQQKILIGIKNKVFEKDLSITDLLSLAGTLGDNLRTNFSIDEMKTLAHLTSEFDFDSMRQISLLAPERLMTTGMINGISYVLPSAGVGNYTAIQNYIAKMLSNDPKVYEDASILVLNGTDTAGLASSERTSLEEENYMNISIDDAPAGTYDAEYTLYTLTDDKPNTKKSLEKRYNLTAKSADELPAGISTAYDFVLILGTPTKTE